MKKLNFDNFTGPQLSAKLLCLIKNFDSQSILSEGQKQAEIFCAQFLDDNFIYNPEDKERIVNNLLLFCLGKESIFNKYISF